VLIHAGAGGVGDFAVQVAKNRGAEVFITTSGDGMDLMRELRVSHVIDYSAEKFEDIAQNMDLVFDLVGGETQSRSWASVATGGTLASTLTKPSQTEAAARGGQAMRYTARPDGKQLTEIAALIDSGKVSVKAAATFPRDAAPDGLKRLEKGHVRGKIVVDFQRSLSGELAL
jgi:NADPH:quinone reductase-like Zn-dependent oxidoreductase